MENYGRSLSQNVTNLTACVEPLTKINLIFCPAAEDRFNERDDKNPGLTTSIETALEFGSQFADTRLRWKVFHRERYVYDLNRWSRLADCIALQFFHVENPNLPERNSRSDCRYGWLRDYDVYSQLRQRLTHWVWRSPHADDLICMR